jgi:hypothetical protein
MQLISIFAKAQPPCAPFWWMAAPQPIDTETQIEKRAAGSLLVCRPRLFDASHSSISTASERPAGVHNGTAAAQQLHSRQRQHARPGLSDGSSSSRGRTALPLGQQLADPAIFAAPHQQISGLDSTYDSCEDTAAEANSASFVRLMQQSQLRQAQQQDKAILEEYKQDIAVARQVLFDHMHGPLHRKHVLESLPLGYMPPGSVSSGSCSGHENEEADQQQHGSARGPAGEFSTQAAQGVDAGVRTAQEQQVRQDEQQLRLAATKYRWGFRPWHVQRAVLLARRHTMLSRVSLLQAAALEAVLASNTVSASAVARLPATAAGVLDAWADGLPCAAAAAAADGSGSGRRSEAVLVRLQHSAAAVFPVGIHLGSAVSQLLRHVGCTGVPVPVPDRAGLLRAAAQKLAQQQQHLAAVLEQGGQQQQHVENSTTQIVLDQAEVDRKAGVSTRQLLWEVLKQLKPSACDWYERGAQHHTQQLRAKLHHTAGLEAPVSRSSEVAPVYNCTSPLLWSTLTCSLASDLLLVPPSIRDLVGNGWAGGAGRLGAGGDGGSSVAGVAARMLVVQYARAARRQYAQVCRMC